jgi:hypothetical protein
MNPIGSFGIPGRDGTLGRLQAAPHGDSLSNHRDKSAYSDNSDNSAMKPPYANYAKCAKRGQL